MVSPKSKGEGILHPEKINKREQRKQAREQRRSSRQMEIPKIDLESIL